MRRSALATLLWLALVAVVGPVRAAGVDQVFEKPKGERSWGEILGWLTGFPWASGQRPFGKSYALVVAINDYKGEATGGFKPLETTRNDPFRMRDFLLKEEGFDQVRVLTNEKVTWDRLRTLMVDEFPRLLKPEDRFLFYWNGHGTQDAEYPDIGYLPLAASDRDSYGSMVSMSDVLDWDRRLRARHVLFLLDSCFSGLAGQETQSGLRDATILQLAKPAHLLMTAGTKDETTIAHERWGGSLFTQALIEAARGRADAQTSFPSDGVVHLSEALGWMRQFIDRERAAAGWRANITPRFRHLRSNEGEFFFLTNDAKAAKLAAAGTQSAADFANGLPVPMGGARPPEAPSLEPVERTGRITATTRVRREPRAGAESVAMLARDAEVYVVGRVGSKDQEWFLVEQDGRSVGYVLARNVALEAEAQPVAPAPTARAEPPVAGGRPAAPLPTLSTPAPSHRVGEVFRDCASCPEMVVVPAGEFVMGSPADEAGRRDKEGPQRRVRIARPFAIGRFEVTFAEWDACVAAGACGGHRPDDRGWGRGRRPVINVSWNDAHAYARWLSATTGKDYRLPSEAEWEYAARAETTSPFWTGATISTAQANYDGNYTYGQGTKGEYREQTVPAGSLPANPWGLHEVHGNVLEWVQDCWHDTYSGAPSDGSPWEGACSGSGRVVRGGSWGDVPGIARSALRLWVVPDVRYDNLGFRVSRTLTP